jgi:single-stranded DNA-binding protein
MSAHALVTGTLYRDPVMRTSKTGKAFVTALLRSESQGETLWVNAVAFDEATQAELLRLKAGEALTIQGGLKVSAYKNNGEHRASVRGRLPCPSPAPAGTRMGGRQERRRHQASLPSRDPRGSVP